MPAIWTPGYNWTDGEVIPENLLQDISNSLDFLKTPTQDRLVNQATTSTTSTSFVDIAGMTITKTTNAYAVEVGFVGSFYTGAALTGDITLLVDGVNQGDATRGLQTVLSTGIWSIPAGFVFRTDVLTAASHIFKLQWKTSTSTLGVQAGWSFWIVER
jgi:hypothetical protein